MIEGAKLIKEGEDEDFGIGTVVCEDGSEEIDECDLQNECLMALDDAGFKDYWFYDSRDFRCVMLNKDVKGRGLPKETDGSDYAEEEFWHNVQFALDDLNNELPESVTILVVGRSGGHWCLGDARAIDDDYCTRQDAVDPTVYFLRDVGLLDIYEDCDDNGNTGVSIRPTQKFKDVEKFWEREIASLEQAEYSKPEGVE
jgi:hypothetical protein